MIRLLFLTWSLTLGAALVVPAMAGTNLDARIAIHLLPVSPGGACSNPAARPACDGIVTTGRTMPEEYFAYVLIMKGDPAAGIAGIQFGIEYDNAPESGVDIWYWAHCGALQFPMAGWPASGTGNLVTWNNLTNCQRDEPGGPGTGVTAIVGYFYLGAYTPDVLRITPRQVDGRAKVADCTSLEYLIEGGGVHHDPSVLGYASFSADGSVPGYNPCDAPSLFECTISGPGILETGAVGTWTGPAAPPGTSWFWSVSGAGTILGSHTGPSVQIQAGTGSFFDLSLTISSGGSSSSCTRRISVPQCTINGPSTVADGTTATFTAATNVLQPVYAWTVTGSAQIVSPPDARTVQVAAMGSEGFTLDLQISGSGGSTSCTRNVTVTPASCAIVGPAAVTEGSTGVIWSPSASITATSYSWTISGNGTITFTMPDGRVVVDAGEPGSFDLTLTAHRSGAPSVSCSRTINVDSLACSIQGPDPVTENQPAVGYTTGPPLSGASYAWSVSGSAAFISTTTEASVLVNTGAAGQFELTVTVARNGRATICTRTVTVSPGTGCTPGRNSQAKIVVHLASRTTKNPCGRTEATPPCREVDTTGQLYPELYFAYVLVAKGNAPAGVAGLEFGITYAGSEGTGVDIYSWSLCASTELPVNGWPWPGGGNRISWDAATRCQRFEPGGEGTGVTANAGYFYVGAYSPDELQVIVHPLTGAARVYDCDGCESVIAPSTSPALGSAAFAADGNSAGYNPCDSNPVPVIRTTWSRIKTMME